VYLTHLPLHSSWARRYLERVKARAERDAAENGTGAEEGDGAAGGGGGSGGVASKEAAAAAAAAEAYASEVCGVGCANRACGLR
jgi:hypothetical protein